MKRKIIEKVNITNAKIIRKLNNLINRTNFLLSENFGTNLENKTYIIKYDIAKKLWKSFNEIKNTINDKNFVGFILIGSLKKGKGVIYGKINPNTDIDIKFIFKKQNPTSLIIAEKALNIILKNTGLKKCKTWNGSSYNKNLYLDQIPNYIQNLDLKKLGNFFDPMFVDSKEKKQIRQKIISEIKKQYPRTFKQIFQDINNLMLAYKFPYIKPYKNFYDFSQTIPIFRSFVKQILLYYSFLKLKNVYKQILKTKQAINTKNI